MSVLGAGTVSSAFPTNLDTRQVFVNAEPSAADTLSRADAELMNDLCEAVIAVQSALGAGINGSFLDVKARLDSFLPSSGNLTVGSVFFGGANGVLAEDPTAFVWDNVNKFLGIGTSSIDERLHVANSNGEAMVQVENESGATTGDVGLKWAINGTIQYTMGIDDSDGDKWKLSASDTLGTSDRLVYDPVTVRLGIGGAPSRSLHLHSMDGQAVLRLSDTGAANTTIARGVIEFYQGAGTGFMGDFGFVDNDNTDFTWQSRFPNANLVLRTNSIERIRITDTGTVFNHSSNQLVINDTFTGGTEDGYIQIQIAGQTRYLRAYTVP